MNFTDSSGLDFDFVREFTIAQTAHLIIDFGEFGEVFGEDGEVRLHPARQRNR